MKHDGAHSYDLCHRLVPKGDPAVGLFLAPSAGHGTRSAVIAWSEG